MKKTNNNRNKKKISMLPIFFTIFLAYFIYTVYNQQIEINSYNVQIEMYTKEIEDGKKLVELYEADEQNLESDEYIEYVARETLGLVKPYEKIFIDISK